MKKYRSIEIPLTTEHYETADQFIEQWMKENRISDTVIIENKLVFEAIFHDIIAQGFGEETILTIKLQRIFGEYCIKLGFEGKSYVPAEEETDGVSPELRIVQAYNDKVGYRYRMGYNSIRITVKRNYRSSLIYCLIGILLAILVYLPISARISPVLNSTVTWSSAWVGPKDLSISDTVKIVLFSILPPPSFGTSCFYFDL